MWNSGSLDFCELPNVLFRNVDCEIFAKKTATCIVFGNLTDKEVKNLDGHGCPKLRDFVEPQAEKNVDFVHLPIQTQDSLLCAAFKTKLIDN